MYFTLSKDQIPAVDINTDRIEEKGCVTSGLVCIEMIEFESCDSIITIHVQTLPSYPDTLTVSSPINKSSRGVKVVSMVLGNYVSHCVAHRILFIICSLVSH